MLDQGRKNYCAVNESITGLPFMSGLVASNLPHHDACLVESNPYGYVVATRIAPTWYGVLFVSNAITESESEYFNRRAVSAEDGWFFVLRLRGAEVVT